jgi:hypothetical protein
MATYDVNHERKKMNTKLIPIIVVAMLAIVACAPVPATGGESVLSDEALALEAIEDESMAMNLGSPGDKSLSDEGLELDERGLIEIAIDSSLGVLRYIPSVSVRDQLVRAGFVVIDQVVSDGPGWIVIHADSEGAPGAIIGYSPVANGLNSNVQVLIDETLTTDVLFAMLHTDSGVLATYEFPGADLPATRGGSVVMEAFSINY